MNEIGAHQLGADGTVPAGLAAEAAEVWKSRGGTLENGKSASPRLDLGTERNVVVLPIDEDGFVDVPIVPGLGGDADLAFSVALGLEVFV